MAIITLNKNESFIAASDASFTGNTGSETVKVLEGVSVVTDATIERVELTRNSNEYTYKAVSTGVQVIYNNAVVASVAAGEKLSFGDGSALVTGTFNSSTGVTTYSLNGVAVSTTAAGVNFAPTTAAGEASTIANTTAFTLTLNTDNINGTSADDTFTANLGSSANGGTSGIPTLQSGDSIKGGAGTDTLKAVITWASNGAISPVTDSVEKLIVQAQTVTNDFTNGNNLSFVTAARIDAGQMNGVNWIEDNNSRTDLVVEDVRTLSKNTTIAMVGTDPGNVDYAVYFDQQALVRDSSSKSSFTIKIRDGLADNATPLGNLDVNGLQFLVGTTTIKLQSDAIDSAKTYADFAKALNDAIAAYATSTTATAAEKAAAATLVATVDPTQFVQINGIAAVGNPIVMTTNSANTISLPIFLHGTNQEGKFVFLGESLPGDSSTLVDLVTTNVYLDNVGRGNMGGDLVIGGLSVGNTDNCDGVERFKVTVKNTSFLNTLASTNDKLQEIIVTNDGTATGGLSIKGAFQTPSQATDPTNLAMPGTQITQNQHDMYGINDIRLFEASSFNGKLDITAELTQQVTAKYMDLKDTNANPQADQVLKPFIYNMGNNDDKLLLAISSANLDAAGTTTREDFDLTVNGGAGKDNLTVKVYDAALVNNTATIAGATDATLWYANSKQLGINTTQNVVMKINGGSGDDVVNTPTNGDFTIDLGDGNDVLYLGNVSNPAAAGSTKAAWLLNAAPTSTLGGNILTTDNNTTTYVPNAGKVIASVNVDVTFYGITANATIKASSVQAAGVVNGYTDLELNQAIKEAITTNSILKNLLTVADGPGNTLIITSKIDGTHLGATDLTLATYLKYTDNSANTVIALPVNYTNGTDTVYAAGAVNALVSDNIVTPGLGDDLVVLGNSLTNSDRVKYTVTGFGADTIVDFTAGAVTLAAGTGPNGNGATDILDFTALGGKGSVNAAIGTVSQLNNSIQIQAETAANDTAAEIAALFTDSANTAQLTHIYIAYDANNVGKVYQVIDAVGLGTPSNITATLIGTIDLADTGWATVVNTNFAG